MKLLSTQLVLPAGWKQKIRHLHVWRLKMLQVYRSLMLLDYADVKGSIDSEHIGTYIVIYIILYSNPKENI